MLADANEQLVPEMFAHLVDLARDARLDAAFRVKCIIKLQGWKNPEGVGSWLSTLHALLVGAIIEDLDMVDLDYALVQTDNRDIDTIWQNLHRGSRNHMRSFHGQLGQLGLVYTGIYLTPQALQAIVTTPHEAGPVDEFGVPLP